MLTAELWFSKASDLKKFRQLAVEGENFDLMSVDDDRFYFYDQHSPDDMTDGAAVQMKFISRYSVKLAFHLLRCLSPQLFSPAKSPPCFPRQQIPQQARHDEHVQRRRRRLRILDAYDSVKLTAVTHDTANTAE